MATDKKTQKIIEDLFQDFFSAAYNSFSALEIQYGVDGVCDQIFGKDAEGQEARANLRKSHAWTTLLAMYDYAVNGIEPGPDFGGPRSLVIDASDILKLAASENYWPSDEWDKIIWMGDGRFGLDEGSPVLFEKVVFLANVDARTVRNAVSAGELLTFKDQTGQVFIENASARRWLQGRRGFKPTVVSEFDPAMSLELVTTPAEFGALLATKRKQIGGCAPQGRTSVSHPSVTSQSIAQLEAGVFALPLDAVFPLADFYSLDRKKFLKCVMRVFFFEEMRLLTEAIGKSEA